MARIPANETPEQKRAREDREAIRNSRVHSRLRSTSYNYARSDYDRNLEDKAKAERDKKNTEAEAPKPENK